MLNLLDYLDKYTHFLVCYITVMYSYHFIGFWGIGVAAAIGIGKEIRDQIKYKGFSWGDLLFDFLGILAGYFNILLLFS